MITLDRKTQLQFSNHECSPHAIAKNSNFDLKLRFFFFPPRTLANGSLWSGDLSVVGIFSLSFPFSTWHRPPCTSHSSHTESFVFPRHPTLSHTSAQLALHSIWTTLPFLVHLGNSYLTAKTSLEISLVSVPSLFNFIIGRQRGINEEVQNNTVKSIAELSEGLDVLISQGSLDIMHPNPSLSRRANQRGHVTR